MARLSHLLASDRSDPEDHAQGPFIGAAAEVSAGPHTAPCNIPRSTRTSATFSYPRL